MPESLLLTKLFAPPPRPNIVLRPRLTERLNQNPQSKLILISAPAGFGKTTLVSEWISRNGKPVAWLSLDEGDNDPARFLTYMVAAIQTVTPDIGWAALAMLQSPQPPPPETILTTLLNEITTIPDEVFLVLDDYHLLDSKLVDDALGFLLDHLSTSLHLIITTREDPSLPLPRYRARGQLLELRAADLRFTPEEAGSFLNQMMDLNLSVESITALETRTEGWIAGLQLAALSMQGRGDSSGFIEAFTGSHRFILDYLVDEVLQVQSVPVRNFLLQTSILDKLSAPLCNAVTAREDSTEMLDTLERNNLFLVPLDDEREWYRYHNLFAEVLRSHLTEFHNGLLPSLHLRASEWFEDNGFRSDAIRHALAAKDFEGAAGLLELAWPATQDKSIQPLTWLGWVKKLPDEMLLTRPVLNAGYAFELLRWGEITEAESRLLDAESQLNSPSEKIIVVDQGQFKSLPATIAIGRAYIAQAFGNIPDTVRYANLVLELPEADPFRRSQASMMLGMTYWASGDLKAAERTFADYTMKLRAAGNIPDAIETTVVLAEMRTALGYLHLAISTSEQLLQFVLDHGDPITPDIADLYRILGILYLELGDLDAAEKQLKKSKEMGKMAELPVWRYQWHIAQAQLAETQGDLDKALAFLDDAERLYIRTPLPDLQPISSMKTRIWLAQGQLSRALEWVSEQGLSADDNLDYLNEFDHITLSRILIAQSRNDRIADTIQAVMHLLDRLYQSAEAGRRMRSMIEIRILQALAFEVQGKTMLALKALESALTIAQPEGYIRLFVNEGKPVAEMLPRLYATDVPIELKQYIHKLIAVFEQQKGIPTFTTTNLGKSKRTVRTQPLIEPLSGRELDVLRLLRTDLSGPEITRELMVSLSTLRTHTQKIYAKLGVNNRRAAVRRAEELVLF